MAASITAVAYVAAPLGTGDWTIEHFMRQMLWLMVPGVAAALALLRFGRPLLEVWARQHRDPAFGLLTWVFGLFALVHLMYGLDARMGTGGASLATPLLYAVVVSL